MTNSRARKSAPASESEAKPQAAAPARAPVAPMPREGKICYFCDRAYPAQVETCEEDGAILVDVGTSPDTGATLRLIKHCPTCAREFDHGYRCPHDNAILATKARDDELLVDTTLGGSYRIGDVIGRGGMGLVYRARQMPIGRAVAIKVLLPSLQPDPTYFTMPELTDTQSNEIREPDKPLAITEPSRVVPPELKRAQRLSRPLLILAIGVALAAAAFAVFYVGPLGKPSTTTVVEIEPESYGDASGVQGATETTITLGMTGDFAGPAEDFGLAMRLGVMARFREQNDLGGVGTRKLKLEALGDGSDPQRAAENVRTLIRDKHVFGFIGTLGTLTSAAAIAASDGALFIGPYADPAGLRASPTLFHYRPDVADECAALVMHLVNHGNVSPRRLAVLAEASPVGDRAAAEVVRTLEQYNVSKDAALRLTYPAGTAEIGAAARDLVRNRARIDAVVAVVPSRAAVRFVEMVRNKRLRIPLAFTSAVGGHALAEGLRRLGDRYLHRIIVSQVVPPFTSDLPGVVRYRKAMAKYFPEAKPGFVSLEGYLVASLFIEAVARIEGGLTIQTLINSLESIHGLDLGFETSISFSATDHQGSERIWITRMNKSGGFEPVK